MARKRDPKILVMSAPLKRAFRRTARSMRVERGLAAFWPALSFLAVALSAGLFGLHRFLPADWLASVLWGAGAIAAMLFAVGLWRWRSPTEAEVLARIDATMAGRPIATLQDQLAMGHETPGTLGLWRAHRDRMAQRLDEARAVPTTPHMARRDPFALRLIALVALAMAGLFGSVSNFWAPSHTDPEGEVAAAPNWEGWIKPPSYTGRPTLYMADLGSEPLSLPVGSQVTIRLYGTPGALDVVETVSDQPQGDETDEMTAGQPLEFQLTNSGHITITGAQERRWQFEAVTDSVPKITANGPLETEISGLWRQPYAARDDYGVTAGFARLTLDLPKVERRYGLTVEPEARDPLELDLSLPFRGDRRDFVGMLEELLVQHPWAGLPVTLTFGANDAAMQVGLSEPESLTLPARRFFDPAAAGLIEMRRDLLWSRANADRTSAILRAINHNPLGDFDKETDQLRLRAIIRKLEAYEKAGRFTPKLRDELAEALWELAVALEEGNLSGALDKLRQAQERLEQAMRDGASDEEIAKLMQEYRDALAEYMQQLAEQSQKNPDRDQAEADRQQQEMTGEQLDQLLDKLQELMEQGRMAEAQELMRRLQEMTENMRVEQGEGNQQSQGEQALDQLGQTLREQQGLSDDTFRELQEGQQGERGQEGQQGQQGQQQGQGQQGQGGQMGQGQQGRGGEEQGQDGLDGGESSGGRDGTPRDGGGRGQPGENGTAGTGGPGGKERLSDRQQALRQMLEEQRGKLGQQGGEGMQRSLDDAGRAMDGAENALRRGDLPGALQKQADALEALRQGMRDLAQELAEERNEGQQGQSVARGGDPTRADPLGREPGNAGELGTEENLLQGQDIYRRAEELLGELRRRSGEQDRSVEERDYLKRLLDRF